MLFVNPLSNNNQIAKNLEGELNKLNQGAIMASIELPDAKPIKSTVIINNKKEEIKTNKCSEKCNCCNWEVDYT